MNEEITLTFPLDHNKPMKIEINGIKGESCKSLTGNLKKGLGTVVSEEPTSEMFEEPVEAQVHLKQGH